MRLYKMGILCIPHWVVGSGFDAGVIGGEGLNRRDSLTNYTFYSADLERIYKKRSPCNLVVGI
jgi:hypothetical protein